jgi:hypothetical protein
MTTLILAGSTIVAASPLVNATETGYSTPDAFYPLTSGVTGTVEAADLPADFAPHLYQWIDGALDRLPDPPLPPAPVPDEVTNFQARAALIAAGLFDAVDAAVRARPSPIALQAWDYANTIKRHGALVTEVAAELDLTEQQLDDLFRAAALIEA